MDLYEEVKKKNTVAFFGNDVYRRFISLCVINRFGYQIRKKNGQVRRSFILVSDVNQVHLEAQTIRNHTDLGVAEFSSDDIQFDKESWTEQFIANHVFVMSCSLFSTLLSPPLISLSSINLIILNDCHLVLRDESYKKVSSFLQSVDPSITRVLAFAPSLMKHHQKPAVIEAIITKMERLLRATRNTVADVRISFRFPVKPKGKVIYYDDYPISFDLYNADQISQLLTDLNTLIVGCQEVFVSEPGINGQTLLKTLRQFFSTIKTMGPFCAMELAEIYAKEVAELVVNSRDFRCAAVTSTLITFFQYVQVTLRHQLSLLHPNQQLQTNVPEKMLSILKVLLDFVPDPEATQSESVKHHSGLNGIIFVEDRTTIRLLAAWLRSVSLIIDCFNFLKVDYLVRDNKLLYSSDPKDNIPSTSRFESTMYKYRKHEINLLIVSSCFEEELDVSKCNLVIRYDFPETFSQYLHSKAKLRTDYGKYVLFIPKNEPSKSQFEQKLRELLSMENIIKDKELEVQGPPPYDTLADLYPAYTTSKDISVDLSNSLNVLYRYCARLPSDTFTRLVPIYMYEQLEDGQIKCTVYLPTNSPVRDPISGLPAKHQEIAQRSAAIECCKALHQAGELNDYLFPVGKENNKCLEELGIKRHKRGPRGAEEEQERPGTTKRRQSYQKKIAEALRGKDIAPGEPCFMYIFLMSLTCPIPEEQNTRGRKLIDPMDSPRFFGLLTHSRISRICDFPVYTRSGEVIVSMKWAAENVTFNSDEIEKIKRFHRFTFTDVLHLVKDPMVYEPAEAPSSVLVLPVNYAASSSKEIPASFTIDSDSVTIDWGFIDRVLFYEQADTSERKANFKFNHSVFEDAVVKPWYRTANEQLHFYVANICENLKPTSQFPTEAFPTFYDYYLQKYKIQITDKDQPLLDVDHTSARLNFLTPRFVNRKGMPLPKSTEKTRAAKRENLESKQLLIPELCIVHPFSASYWNKAVCLPSILYRVNHLLIADQLRRQVALDIGIGVTKDDPEFSWPTLDFGWSLTEVLNQSFEEKDDDEYDINVSSPKTLEVKPSKKNKPSPSSAAPLPPKISSPPAPVEVKNISTESTQNKDGCDDLLIDTFDPNIYKVVDAEVDDDLGDIPPVGNWDQNSQEFNQPFEISAISPIINWPGLDDEPRVVELSDDNKPIKRKKNQRMGSPSNFDRIGENKNWDIKESDLNSVIDLDIPGLNLISTAVGVDLHKLSKDLEDIHAFDDFDDSEDEDELGSYEEEADSHLDADQLLIPDSDGAVSAVKANISRDILSSGLLLSYQSEPAKVSEESSYYDEIEIPSDDMITAVELDKEKVESIFVADEIIVPDKDANCDTIDKTIDKIADKLEEALKLVDPVTVLPNIEEKDSHVKASDIAMNLEEGKASPSFGELLPNRDEFVLNADNNGDSVLTCIHLDPLNEEFDPEIGPSPAMVLQALTMSNASDGINLERLETVGDSFLKYAVTVFMYCRCPDQHEGILSQLRSTQISNLKLYELGSQKNLGELMVATKFEPSDNWLPPGFKIPEKCLIGSPSTSNDEKLISFNCLLTQQSIPDKSIADCVEALIGSFLISCGPRGALLFMKWLGLMVMDNVEEPQEESGLWRWLNPIKPPLFPNAPKIELDNLYFSHGLDRFEKEIIQYEFKDKAYLVQAFTHNSFSDNRVTDCYQRLEFLGDAVLDFLITRHLFDDPRQHSPGVLTDLRSALANNTFFASLAVEYEFHKYLMYKTADLHKVISKFVEFHGNSNGKIKDPAAFALLIGEADCEQREDIEVPKALGDVFESVAGAIFLDSGFSLDTVWRVYYRMMRPEMEYYSKNPPKSPIRELLEMKPQKVSFSKPDTVNINGVPKVKISVEVFNIGKYYGIGRNRRLAKYTAAKRALRDLKSSNNSLN
ncbi:endoribonuclease Dicer-like [Tetranychus urticae]|nr:endoribonuclease Dicer-like [Tetranychus urticae]